MGIFDFLTSARTKSIAAATSYFRLAKTTTVTRADGTPVTWAFREPGSLVTPKQMDVVLSQSATRYIGRGGSWVPDANGQYGGGFVDFVKSHELTGN